MDKCENCEENPVEFHLSIDRLPSMENEDYIDICGKCLESPTTNLLTIRKEK